MWAGPAQIILITTLGSGASIVQSAIAVTVSAIRLFPMVVSVLPLMRTPQPTPLLGLVLFPLVSMMNSGLDILVSGVVAGTDRLWRPLVAGAGAHERFHRQLACAGMIWCWQASSPTRSGACSGCGSAAAIDEGSELLMWVRAVATAILAGVIAQILVQPPGALASVPAWLRYGAVAAGFAVSC